MNDTAHCPLYLGFRRELADIRCHPKGTVKTWSGAVRRFLQSGQPITPDGIRGYLGGARCKPVTKKSYLAALKVFAGWLHEEQLLSELEMLRIARVKGPPPTPSPRQPLPLGQVEQLIATTTPVAARAFNPDVRQLRDAALIELAYATGLRIGELISLDLGCLRSTTVPGVYLVSVVRLKKGAGPTLANQRAYDAVAAYLARRRELAHPRTGHLDSRALFVGALQGRRLNDKQAYKIICDRGKAAGFHAHPHILRHSFATHLGESGVSPLDVKDLLGQSSLQSTAVYIHPSLLHLAQVYRQHHPHATATATGA